MERSLAGLIIAAFMLACGWKVRRKGLQLGVFVGNDAAGKARQRTRRKRCGKHCELLPEKRRLERDKI
jgi:hypothetical protein